MLDEKFTPVFIIFLLSIVGIFGNLRVAFAAWSLRRSSTCHRLIFARAILDMVHQSGHFVTVFLMFSGTQLMLRKTCFILEFLPFSAVIGTSMMTLSIGIDRFLGFHAPLVKKNFKIIIYIGTVYLLTAVFAFTFMLLFLFTMKNMNELTFCMPGSVISERYMFVYFYTMSGFYGLTMITYATIWVTSCKKRKKLAGYMRIMKPITIIVCISLTGWLSNYIFEIVARRSHHRNKMLLTLWNGISINLSVACDFWVYWFFSLEYREKFSKQWKNCAICVK